MIVNCPNSCTVKFRKSFSSIVKGAEGITSKLYPSQLTFNQCVDISFPLLATSKRDLYRDF